MSMLLVLRLTSCVSGGVGNSYHLITSGHPLQVTLGTLEEILMFAGLVEHVTSHVVMRNNIFILKCIPLGSDSSIFLITVRLISI